MKTFLAGGVTGKDYGNAEEDIHCTQEDYDNVIQNLLEGRIVNFGIFSYTPPTQFFHNGPCASLDINKEAVFSHISNGTLTRYDSQHQIINEEVVDADEIKLKKKAFKSSFKQSEARYISSLPYFAMSKLTLGKKYEYVTDEGSVVLEYNKTYRLRT